MSGWGKSYHGQAIMESSIPAFDYVPILDFKDEYRGLVKSGLASHLLVGPREATWSVVDWRTFLESNGAVVLARHQLKPERWRTVCARISQAARDLAGPGNNGSLVVVDEAHFVAPQRGTVPPAIEGLATTGRGEGASSLWITQRLAKLEETVVSQADETLAGGFTSGNDRAKLDPEYPEYVHNPEHQGTIHGLPEELHADDGAVSLRKFEDEDGNTTGSEWIYSNAKGERERRDTSNMSMETTHYGPEGHPIQDPDY